MTATFTIRTDFSSQKELHGSYWTTGLFVREKCMQGSSRETTSDPPLGKWRRFDWDSFAGTIRQRPLEYLRQATRYSHVIIPTKVFSPPVMRRAQERKSRMGSLPLFHPVGEGVVRGRTEETFWGKLNLNMRFLHMFWLHGTRVWSSLTGKNLWSLWRILRDQKKFAILFPCLLIWKRKKSILL